MIECEFQFCKILNQICGHNIYGNLNTIFIQLVCTHTIVTKIRLCQDKWTRSQNTTINQNINALLLLCKQMWTG